MTAEQKLKAIKSLLDSDGWRLLVGVLDEELIAASLDLASNPRLTPDEIQYKRGAVWAASKLPTIPQRLLAAYENELLMQQINERKGN